MHTHTVEFKQQLSVATTALMLTNNL